MTFTCCLKALTPSRWGILLHILICPFGGGGLLCLDRCLEFGPRVPRSPLWSTEATLVEGQVEVRAILHLLFVPWSCPYNWGNSLKTAIRTVESVHCLACWFPFAFGQGLSRLWWALSRQQCLPSCRSRGFLTLSWNSLPMLGWDVM
jgi:hypothetical protein